MIEKAMDKYAIIVKSIIKINEFGINGPAEIRTPDPRRVKAMS